MSTEGLHVERTALAWSRTWLSAVLGLALALRLVAEHGQWWLVASLTVLAVLSTVSGLPVAPAWRAAALVATVITIGVLTAASATIRLLVG